MQTKVDDIMEQIEKLAKRDEVQQTEIHGLADSEAKLHNELNECVQSLAECDQKQENQIRDLAGHEKKNREEIEILKAKVESLVEHLEGQDDPADMQTKVDDIMEQIEKLAKRDETQQAEIQNVADKVEDVADKEAKLQAVLNERVQLLT
ncbi:putative viral A-type inclusion protein, partial [Gregarina niphandrodes]